MAPAALTAASPVDDATDETSTALLLPLILAGELVLAADTVLGFPVPVLTEQGRLRTRVQILEEGIAAAIAGRKNGRSYARVMAFLEQVQELARTA